MDNHNRGNQEMIDRCRSVGPQGSFGWAAATHVTRMCRAGLLIMLCVILALLGCTNRRSQTEQPAEAQSDGEQAPRLAVEVITIERTPFVAPIEVSGIVAGVNEAEVVAETRGIIIGVDFDLGERCSGRTVAGAF